MYNRRYEKVFLMLRQETEGYGYALGKRPPWGSCVMELKNGAGRLQLTVQGLRPLRNSGYDVYVLAGEESIFCGVLHPDTKEGHGELKWEFDPDAVGEGKCAEDFHTVVVLAENGRGSFSAPLTAFFGEKRDWKAHFTPKREKESYAEEKEEIEIQAAEASLPVQSTPEKAELQDSNAKIAEAQKASYHGSFQGLLARFRQELEELEETGILSTQETEKIRSMGTEQPDASKEEIKEEEAEKPKEEAVVKKEQQKLLRKEQKDDSLFGRNRELQPFGDGEAWKCISLEELTLLSQIPLKWQKEFFFLLPYRRYHHLILQEKEDGIRLGLPGMYREDDAADAKRFGFGEFHRVDDDWGYWLAFLEKEG